VLQSSHDEPVVRQALVVLSSLHLEYVMTDPHSVKGSTSAEDVNKETLIQYNKALRLLRKYLGGRERPSIKVALICCTLFHCFESTRGNTGAALDHLRNGLMILGEAQTPRVHPSCMAWDSPEDMEKVTQVFSRLDLQATIFDDSRTPSLMLTSADERSGTTPCVATVVFSDLEEAHVTLIKLQNWLFRLLTTNIKYKFWPQEQLPAFIVEEKHNLEEQYKRWSQTFEEFMKQQQLQDEPDKWRGNHADQKSIQEGASALRIHYRITQMLLLASLPEDQTIFGSSPNPAAEEIIDLAETFLARTRDRNATAAAAQTPHRNFSSETGIIAPLFLLAMKCSDVHVCEKAVALLAASHRREGLYDAQMVVGIVERMTRLKERGQAARLMSRQTATGMPAEDISLEYWGAEVINEATGGVEGIAKTLNISA